MKETYNVKTKGTFPTETDQIDESHDIKDGKTMRPVKSLFSNSSTANVILTRAKNLKQSDQYSTVYISPDRSPEERVTHKQLVLHLKKKRDS